MTSQLRTFQSNLTGGELAPSMWSRPDITKYQTGVKKATNWLIKPQGGMRNRGGTLVVGALTDSSVVNKQLPFDIAGGESYVLDFGHLNMRVIRNGAYVLDSARVVTATAVTAAAPAVFTAVAHGFANGELVYLDEIDDPYYDGGDFTVADVTTNTFTLRDIWGQAVQRTGRAALTSARVTAHYVVVTPYGADDLAGLNFAQDHATMYLLSLDHAPHKLNRIAPDDWTLALEDFTPDTVVPTGVTASTVVAAGVVTPVTYVYRVSAIDGATGEESLPSATDDVANDLSIAGNKNKVSWTAVAGASLYTVYKEDNGIFGYIGGTTGLEFVDENITPDLSDTPQQVNNPFSGAGNYPKVGTFFEQRLWLACTRNNPGAVYASQTVNPSNFQKSSPLKGTDSIAFRVRANRVIEIESIVPAEQLMLLTRSGEWLVTGGEQKGYLTPTNPVLRQRAFRGSAAVQPVLVGDFVVHVQRGGDAVRDLNMARDVTSTELSLLAKHLLRNDQIVDMAYQQNPDSVVWCVTQRGKLLALTYMLEHDIWGWTSMETQGKVEGVTVVTENAEDVLYIQTVRTINGTVRRFVERMDTFEAIEAKDAHYLDAGARFDLEEPVTELYGLRHLEGEAVSLLLDGGVFHGVQVVDGRVDLPVPASAISVGLRYTSTLQTLDLDIGAVSGMGSMLGRLKSITNVQLRVENTRGIFVSHDDPDRAVEYRQRAAEAWGEAIALYTGTIEITPLADWTMGGGLVVEQRDPLPATLNGLLLDWEFGE